MKSSGLTTYAKLLVPITMLFAAAPAYSGTYTSWATVSQVERVSGGLLIIGTFGDANSCGTSDKVFYPSTHADYETVVSMAIAALVSGREMRFYIDACTTVSFHYGQTPIINQSANGNAIYMR